MIRGRGGTHCRAARRKAAKIRWAAAARHSCRLRAAAQWACLRSARREAHPQRPVVNISVCHRDVGRRRVIRQLTRLAPTCHHPRSGVGLQLWPGAERRAKSVLPLRRQLRQRGQTSFKVCCRGGGSCGNGDRPRSLDGSDASAPVTYLRQAGMADGSSGALAGAEWFRVKRRHIGTSELESRPALGNLKGVT